MPTTSAWDRFLFGLCFGMGFQIAVVICMVIGWVFSKAGLHQL